VSDHNALSAVVALDAPSKTVGEPTPITTIGGLSTSLP
jgi:hypothetical protein